MYDPGQLSEPAMLKNMSVGYGKAKTNVKKVSHAVAKAMGHKTK